MYCVIVSALPEDELNGNGWFTEILLALSPTIEQNEIELRDWTSKIVHKFLEEVNDFPSSRSSFVGQFNVGVAFIDTVLDILIPKIKRCLMV